MSGDPLLDHPVVVALLDTLSALIARRLQASQTAAKDRPGPLLSKQDLAVALGVSVPKIDRLAREGRIPYVLVGDTRRFDLDEVRAALPHVTAAHAEPTPGLVTAEPANQVRYATRRRRA